MTTLPVDDSWRVAQADALAAQALAIRDALVELSNVHSVLVHRDRPGLAQELRTLAGGLRAEAATIDGEANALRAIAANGAALPRLRAEPEGGTT